MNRLRRVADAAKHAFSRTIYAKQPTDQLAPSDVWANQDICCRRRQWVPFNMHYIVYRIPTAETDKFSIDVRWRVVGTYTAMSHRDCTSEKIHGLRHVFVSYLVGWISTICYSDNHQGAKRARSSLVTTTTYRYRLLLEVDYKCRVVWGWKLN